MSGEASVTEPPRAAARRELALWLAGAVALTVVLVGTVLALGGRVEAATWGLVVAAGAMVLALRSLYRMATVLARPPVEAVLDVLDVPAYAGQRELREERRRLLRAINELQFDYEMGKLSEADYRAVRQGYELQAVEVIRALDAEATLHPALQAELRRRGIETDQAAKSDVVASDVAASDVVASDVAASDAAASDVAASDVAASEAAASEAAASDAAASDVEEVRA